MQQKKHSKSSEDSAASAIAHQLKTACRAAACIAAGLAGKASYKP
jgi:hypothetical protein